MTKIVNKNLDESYFEWLCNFINKEHKGYNKLLLYLHNRSFYWTCNLDENRYADGMGLRDMYAKEKKLNNIDYLYLSNKPCSILEALIALVIRYDENLGTSTHILFWKMMHNLSLDFEKDERYNEENVIKSIDIWENRKYEKNGLGNIFYIPDTEKNMLEADIWQQGMWYINYLEEDN